MSLLPLVGHEATRRGLAAARASGKLPQVLMVVGPEGIGKQRLALWLAQLVLCAEPAQEPCGVCRACRLVANLVHSDLHWFIPILRPKASEPDKQIEEAREALGAVIAERRLQPLYEPPDGLAAHGVASARLMLRIGSLTTVEGGLRVFIIGDAERLVSQESSPEAANALLKFLEEPPASTLIILTTTDLTRVLPTIRSRAVPVRLAPLPTETVAQFLEAHGPADVSTADRAGRADQAGGSIGRALSFGPSDERQRAAVEQLLAAARGGDVGRHERVIVQMPWQARGDFTTMLEELQNALRDAVRQQMGQRPAREIPRALRDVTSAPALVRAIERVGVACEAAQGNQNPQLLLATLTADLAEIL
ncbi:MAG: hypothetical protein ABI647_20270 [Gemmatimonadota bacterium]